MKKNKLTKKKKPNKRWLKQCGHFVFKKSTQKKGDSIINVDVFNIDVDKTEEIPEGDE